MAPAQARQKIAVIDTSAVEIPRKPVRAVRGTPVPVVDPDAARAKDVIAALVAAGYNKSAAQSAVAACDPSDRGSEETWMLAALRNCRRA